MINLDKNIKYMVAVSGGADSMSLLDMAYKSGLNIVVGHVNYKKRISADRDQHIVEAYCEKRNIPLFVHIAKKHTSGNFQNEARIERYKFFEEVMKENNISYLLVAHQLDDALETYLFRKKRNSVGESLTIKEKSNVFGINVIRPLLNYYREDLRNYCLDNHIEFGDDETNFTLDYERNRIRILVLGNLNRKQKDELVHKMKKENEDWIIKNKKINEFYNKNVVDLHFKYEAFKCLDNSMAVLFLYHFFENNMNQAINKHHLQEIVKQLSSKPNISINVGDMYLVRAYDDVYLTKPVNSGDYEYIIDEIKEMKTPYFEIKQDGLKQDGIYVSESDFPLTIRNYRPGDKVRMKDYDKDVKRLFIDRKLSKEKRDVIPLVINSSNEIILIPSIYRLYERKLLRSNIFVI